MNKRKGSVLLDTAFIIRLLSQKDILHENAKGYYEYFLRNHIEMKLSTVSIAEYCVKGDIVDIPFKSCKIIPFNIDHAKIASAYARTLFEVKKKGELDIDNRLIIPNDAKLFAQANVEQVSYFVTSDIKAAKLIDMIKIDNPVCFQHIDISTPYGSRFGELPL